MKLTPCFFFSSRRRHTRCSRDWSSDVCSSDLGGQRRHNQRKGCEEAESGEVHRACVLDRPGPVKFNSILQDASCGVDRVDLKSAGDGLTLGSGCSPPFSPKTVGVTAPCRQQSQKRPWASRPKSSSFSTS